MRRPGLLGLVLLAGWLSLGVPPAWGQRKPDPNKGDNKWTQWGVLDGNRVRTLFANHGEVARWPDQPSGEWPKGSGRSYVDGVAVVVSARTRDSRGQWIYPMSTNYREFIDRDPITKVPWGWAPLPGYANPRQPSPARSDDPGTWPPFWPDRPMDWAGFWNGYFGKGVQNADVETYFVFDDSPDREWTLPPHRFFPDPSDTTRGGLGLEVATRGFQWSHPLAQDVIFWHYEITNEGKTSYDEAYFAQYIDWGVGGTDDSGDDEGAYNTFWDLAFAWDADGIGTPGRWAPVGTAGYAFLESPGNHTNARDDDEDGITDERRDSGPGQLIVGKEAIGAYLRARYNLVRFERFYGPLEDLPAYRIGRWWTGDENLNWVGFEDLNGNGRWDPDEPLNDDLGADGLGPGMPGYEGPDAGEGDGMPTAGEPNFDATDKDESDQIGLTGFAIFDVHRYELIDDEENFRLFSRGLPPLDTVLAGGRNLGMFFSSGPLPLRVGQTERFSMALLFAEKDYTDPRRIDNSALARKKETVQQIYNANYRFARPPDKPKLRAFAGDGQVVLVWDDLAERSFDPFTRERDFEGYMIFKSTEPNFLENLLITDAYGNPTLQKPIAQFDLKNGLRGPHPVSINGVQFNLGTDSGLQHSFIDRDVRNGTTYFYAVVAYDRGWIQRNVDGSVATNPDGTVRGIAPSMTTAVIKPLPGGRYYTDVNTAVVTPRPPAAGYVPPELLEWQVRTVGTGSIQVQIVAPSMIERPARYRITFQNPSPWGNGAQVRYRLENLTTGQLLEEGLIQDGRRELPLYDGFIAELRSPTQVALIDTSVRLTDRRSTYAPLVRPGTVSTVVATRFEPLPADFEVRFTEGFADTSRRLAFGLREIPTPFYIQNLTTGQRQPFILIEDVDSLRNGRYDHGDLIILVMGERPGEPPVFQGGRWRASWAIRIVPPDPDLEPGKPRIPPRPGTVLRFRTEKPFQTGDQVSFAITPPAFDPERARERLRTIYVVPNPYVATSLFEPPNPYKAGRGERRLYFRNLPPECTIRIYTITGHLVQTLYHKSDLDNGQLAWDLTNKDGMNIAYGVYIFHVEAPGIGEYVGRFAVIK
ncbi:MAG: hypothetical protein N2561_00235 [Bacteroidetes bacterium]|nr:hypothetical protein [Bacteroidota bacterium]MDW8285763.1 hypothetical protein [Bacteroidota bacterium]